MTGNELKEYRKRLDMTQADLANALGVTSTTVARWERGEKTPPPFLDLALKQIEAEQPKDK